MFQIWLIKFLKKWNEMNEKNLVSIIMIIIKWVTKWTSFNSDWIANWILKFFFLFFHITKMRKNRKKTYCLFTWCLSMTKKERKKFLFFFRCCRINAFQSHHHPLSTPNSSYCSGSVSFQQKKLTYRRFFFFEKNIFNLSACSQNFSISKDKEETKNNHIEWWILSFEWNFSMVVGFHF